MKEEKVVDRMSEDIVRAVLEAIPVETTVIDANDEVVGWNKHEARIFHRPMSCMGLNFRDCHPQESLPRVLKIVEEMKAGSRDSARFWIDLEVVPGQGRHKILIEFRALRDAKGRYIGCLESSQDVEEIRALTGEHRLADEPLRD